MQLGFVSAILPELSLEEVFTFAADEKFDCVEVMCWPPGGADRRYAGVTHVDVTKVDDASISRVRSLVEKTGVQISGLGYYPNPLHPDLDHRRKVVDHLHAVMRAAPKFGVKVVNTFVGRDPKRSVPENWKIFDEVWPALLQTAEQVDVVIGIENCPMIFTLDEWPGGCNLPTTPTQWRTLFSKVPAGRLGLNFDPSHLVWQHIDIPRAIRDFGKQFVHVHAKDTRVDVDKIYSEGIMGLGWHTPKLPGLGDVNWTQFFSALTDTGYRGAVCIEVEDRAYEGSLANRQRSLRQSRRYLEQFMR